MKTARTDAYKIFAKVLALTGLLVAAQPVRAQTPAQSPEPPKPAAAAQQAVPTNNVISTVSPIVLVDAVVTDKKGHYIADLKQGDFKVFEDNKEQTISSFSFEADPTIQSAGQRHYMILFFDNSSMGMPEQM